MTIDEFRALVATLTYKPGWMFNVYRHRNRWVFSVTMFTVPVDAEFMSPEFLELMERNKDIVIPGEIVSGAFMPTQFIPARFYLTDQQIELMTGRADVIRFVVDALLELEEHELKEWFKVGGVREYEPHPAERGRG